MTENIWLGKETLEKKRIKKEKEKENYTAVHSYIVERKKRENDEKKYIHEGVNERSRDLSLWYRGGRQRGVGNLLMDSTAFSPLARRYSPLSLSSSLYVSLSTLLYSTPTTLQPSLRTVYGITIRVFRSFFT